MNSETEDYFYLNGETEFGEAEEIRLWEKNCSACGEAVGKWGNEYAREVAKKKKKKTGEENNRGAIREKKRAIVYISSLVLCG